MSALHEILSSTPKGARALAAANLKYQVLKVLHGALSRSQLTQAGLAKRLGVRRSAVNQVFNGDGNVRVSTLAEYLHEMGAEAVLEVVPAGTLRRRSLEEQEKFWRSSGQPARRVVSSPVTTSSRAVDDVNWRGSSRGARSVAVPIGSGS